MGRESKRLGDVAERRVEPSRAKYGEPLDPDEIKSLANLSPRAAAAYDHLEADSMRRAVDSLTAKLELLQAQLSGASVP